MTYAKVNKITCGDIVLFENNTSSIYKFVKWSFCKEWFEPEYLFTDEDFML